jgi:hypothetical protein
VVGDDSGEPLADAGQLDGDSLSGRAGPIARGHGVDGTSIWPEMICFLYFSSCGTMSSMNPPLVE